MLKVTVLVDFTGDYSFSTQMEKPSVLKTLSFNAEVVDTGDYTFHSNIFANFRVKFRNGSCKVFRAMGERDMLKKPEAENIVSDSL